MLLNLADLYRSTKQAMPRVLCVLFAETGPYDPPFVLYFLDQLMVFFSFSLRIGVNFTGSSDYFLVKSK